MMKHSCCMGCCSGILLLLLGLGIPLTAAQQEVPATGDKQWGKQVEGYELSLSTEKNEVLPDEPIFVRIALRNSGESDATIVRLPFLPFCKIEVRSAKDEIAPLTLFGKSASKLFSVMTQPLAKGDEFVVIVQLNRLYDMTLPGRYKVTATRTVWRRDGSGGTAGVVSNTIEVRVKDPGDRTIQIEETVTATPADDLDIEERDEDEATAD